MGARAAEGILIAVLLTGFTATAHGADEIKGGKWQFTTQMQMPVTAPSQAGGAQARPGGAPDMTRTACIDAANPIPAEAQCKIDKVERNGGVVTWAMTCNSPRGPIQSAGSARYAGDTMEATMTARVPGPSGQPVDTPGRITGRYLGPCDTK
jgi:Protein of unknown function (DUF3617)